MPKEKQSSLLNIWQRIAMVSNEFLFIEIILLKALQLFDLQTVYTLPLPLSLPSLASICWRSICNQVSLFIIVSDDRFYPYFFLLIQLPTTRPFVLTPKSEEHPVVSYLRSDFSRVVCFYILAISNRNMSRYFIAAGSLANNTLLLIFKSLRESVTKMLKIIPPPLIQYSKNTHHL